MNLMTPRPSADDGIRPFGLVLGSSRGDRPYAGRYNFINQIIDRHGRRRLGAALHPDRLKVVLEQQRGPSSDQIVKVNKDITCGLYALHTQGGISSPTDGALM